MPAKAREVFATLPAFLTEARVLLAQIEARQGSAP